MFVIGFLRVLYPFIIKKIKNNFKWEIVSNNFKKKNILS